MAAALLLIPPDMTSPAQGALAAQSSLTLVHTGQTAVSTRLVQPVEHDGAGLQRPEITKDDLCRY